MDPISAGLGVAVVTLLAKAWERASDRAIDGAEGLIDRLVASVRRRFADDADEAGTTALALLEQAPDSARARDGLAIAVERHASNHAGFRDELRGLLEEASQAGLVAGPASQTAWGTGVVQVQNTQGSDIRIHQDRPGSA